VIDRALWLFAVFLDFRLIIVCFTLCYRFTHHLGGRGVLFFVVYFLRRFVRRCV